MSQDTWSIFVLEHVYRTVHRFAPMQLHLLLADKLAGSFDSSAIEAEYLFRGPIMCSVQ